MYHLIKKGVGKFTKWPVISECDLSGAIWLE